MSSTQRAICPITVCLLKFSEKFQSGGGGIFQSKNLFSRFWELYTRLFEIKLKFPLPPTPQNGLYLWKSCACISYYLALVPPYIYSTISIIKKLKHNFPKMRGGGQRPYGIFSKNSSNFAQPSFPYSTTGKKANILFH